MLLFKFFFLSVLKLHAQLGQIIYVEYVIPKDLIDYQRSFEVKLGEPPVRGPVQ